jgi:hypothetical protein
MAIKIPILTEFNKKGIRDAEATLGQFGKNIGIAFAAVGAAAIAAGVVVADFASKSISAAENVRQADDRLKQVANSMGLFGAQTDAVSQRLINFAESNEIVLATDAELIKSTQAKLLTFKNLATTADETGGAFDRATMAALDLAAAGFGSAESNATQLGKALQDPIKGLNALTRSGVTFTAQEKENIKVLVQSGKTLQAQDLILQAIETQVGGTAEATAKASDKMKLAFENIYEQVGEALLPAFDEFVVVLTDLTPQISDALVPVAEHLADVFKTDVLPAIQNFTKWLASPEGTKKLREFTDAIIAGIEEIIIFTTAVINNWDAIKNTAIAIGTAVVVYKTLTTAIQVATAAQLLLNIAVDANPYVAFAKILATVVTAIVAASVALTAFTDSNKKAREAATGLTGRSAELVAEQVRLKELLDAGVITFKEYEDAMKPVQEELGLITKDSILLRKETIKLNDISLSKFRSQLGDTRIDGEKLVANARELAYYMNGGKAGGYKPLVDPADEITTPSGPTAAEKAAEAFKKVQKLIKDTGKRVRETQADYRQAVNKAELEYLQNESDIRKEYTDKLLSVIQDSKNRIREAFRQTASLTVASFLSEFKAVEAARLTAFEEAKQAAKEAGSIFTEAFVDGDPVDAYLKTLRNKVLANAKVLQVSGKLVEAGFSQTFIEQIIATGEEGGLKLAEGLLAANPEVIKEVQALYKDIERVSETGADALADTLYEKQGLATTELVKLYESTQQQLLDALEANYLDYTKSLDDAATALKDSIKDITDDFNDAITEMGGNLGGLMGTVKQFQDWLDGVAGSTTAATSPLSPRGAMGKTTDGVGFKFDLENALGSEYGAYMTGKPQTVINVNVSTDASQSVAMVGKAIGNTITKYVSTGGQVRVVSGSVAV